MLFELATALQIYDNFIDRSEGWCQGSVGFSKAIYRRLIEEIAVRFADEPLVTQYLELVRGCCNLVSSEGHPVPLEHVVGG